MKRKFLEKFTLKSKAEEEHLRLHTLQDRMELGLILFVLSTLRSTEYFKNMGGTEFRKIVPKHYTLRLNNDLLLDLFLIFFWADGRGRSSWFELLKFQRIKNIQSFYTTMG